MPVYLLRIPTAKFFHSLTGPHFSFSYSVSMTNKLVQFKPASPYHLLIDADLHAQ